MFQKFIFLQFILAYIQSQQFIIPLKRQPILFQKSIQEAIEIESVYYTECYFGEKTDQNFRKTLIDITSSSNWIMDINTEINTGEQNENIGQEINQKPYICHYPQCRKYQQYGQETILAYGEQIQFKAQGFKQYTHQLGSVDIQIQNVNFELSPVWFALSIQLPILGYTPLFQYFQHSLGLGPKIKIGPQYKGDFDKDYKPFSQTAFKRLKTLEFSLIFSQQTSQLIFGPPIQYFVQPGQKWHHFQNQRNKKSDGATFSTYALFSQAILIGNDSDIHLYTQSQFSKEKTMQQSVIFDSTTKYIWFGETQTLTQIIEYMNQKYKLNCEEDQQLKLYFCDSQQSQFPDLYFNINDDFNQKEVDLNSYKLHIKSIHYTEQLDNNKVLLLLRNGIYGKQAPYLQNFSHIWLGYPFFQEHYFSVKQNVDNIQENTISIAQKYSIPFQQKHINQTFVLYILFFMVLVIILFIIILLYLGYFSKIWFSPPNLTTVSFNLNKSKRKYLLGSSIHKNNLNLSSRQSSRAGLHFQNKIELGNLSQDINGIINNSTILSNRNNNFRQSPLNNSLLPTNFHIQNQLQKSQKYHLQNHQQQLDQQQQQQQQFNDQLRTQLNLQDSKNQEMSIFLEEEEQEFKGYKIKKKNQNNTVRKNDTNISTTNNLFYLEDQFSNIKKRYNR